MVTFSMVTGNVTEYTYDEFNRVLNTTEKLSATTINETVNSNYDANSRPLTVTTNGQATTFVYNNMGQMTSRTLPGSRTVTYTYKDTGELDTVDGADTYKKAFGYDTQGRMSTFTTYQDANTPEVTTQAYNGRGLMTSKTYDDDNATTYTYNDDGQLATRVWDRNITTTYGYDNAGRKLTIDYSDSTTDITYTYDWMSNVSTVADAEGTRTFAYNYTTTGHPGLVSVTVPGIVNRNVNYTYDSYGRKTAMILKNNSTPEFTNNYAYNATSGRLATVGDGTYTANYTYQSGTGLLTQNQITRDSDSAVMTTHNRTYDTRTNNYHQLTAANTTGQTTRTYTYVYNSKDQRTKLTLPDGTYWDYTYDSKGQVASGIKYDSSDNPISGQYFGYNYDLIGNRIWEKDGTSANQVDYTTNLVNQYSQRQPPTPAPTESFTYDTDGNILTSRGWNNTWNGENRLIETYNDTVGKKLEFVYDYLGRRIEKKVYTGTSGTTWTLSTTQKFVYDGFKQIAEYNASDVLQKSYTWQPVVQDVPLWVKDSTNYYYYIVDGNKNVRAMVDTTGNLVASYDYNAFGKITSSGTYSA